MIGIADEPDALCSFKDIEDSIPIPFFTLIVAVRRPGVKPL